MDSFKLIKFPRLCCRNCFFSLSLAFRPFSLLCVQLHLMGWCWNLIGVPELYHSNNSIYIKWWVSVWFGLGWVGFFVCLFVFCFLKAFFLESLIWRKTPFPFYFFFFSLLADRGRENSRQRGLWHQCPTESSGFPSHL